MPYVYGDTRFSRLTRTFCALHFMHTINKHILVLALHIGQVQSESIDSD